MLSWKNTKIRRSIVSLAGRSCLLSGLLAMSVLTAEAQTRRQPDTTGMTCSKTHDLITRFGAINMKSGPYKFDRYVTNRTKCFANEAARTTYVPTQDSKQCAVLICVERDRNGR